MRAENKCHLVVAQLVEQAGKVSVRATQKLFTTLRMCMNNQEITTGINFGVR